MDLTFDITLALVASPGGTGDPETLGALTLAGEGGIPTTASAIASGDLSNHWQILNGRLTPTAAGDAVNMNGGTAGVYSLGLTGDTDREITIVDNRKDVATSAELRATYPGQSNGVTSGQTVALRAGTYDVGSSSLTNAFSGTSGLSDYVVWQNLSSTRSDVQLQYNNGTRNADILFHGVGSKWLEINGCQINHNHDPTYRPVNDRGSDGKGSGSLGGIIWLFRGGDFRLINCDLISDLVSWENGGNPQYECSGVYAIQQCNDVTVTGCDITGVCSAFRFADCSRITLDDNDLHGLWGDSCNWVTDNNHTHQSMQDLDFTRNRIWDLWGTYSYLHQDTLFQTWNKDGQYIHNLLCQGNIAFCGAAFFEASPSATNECDNRPFNMVQTGNYITSNTTISSEATWEVVATGGTVVITLAPWNGNDYCIIRRPESTSDVIVRTQGGDTIDGSTADITLTSTGPRGVTLENTAGSVGNWGRNNPRLSFGPLIQGCILQSNGPREDFYFKDNIVFANNRNMLRLGTWAMGSSHNSFIEIFPKDNDGDGQIRDEDGRSNGGPEISNDSSVADCFIYHSVASQIQWPASGTYHPDMRNNHTVTALNFSQQQAAFQITGNHSQPSTLSEALNMARVKPGGPLDLGSGAYTGAIGTSLTNGPWDWTNKRRNPTYATTHAAVRESSTPSNAATGVSTTQTIYITFSTPFTRVIRNGGNLRLMNGATEIERFNLSGRPGDNDWEIYYTIGAGNNGKCHREGQTLIINPTTSLPGSTLITVEVDSNTLFDVYENDLADINSGELLRFTTA